MTYLDKLKDHLGEKAPGREPPKPPKPGLSGFSGYSGGLISPTDALRLCRAGLTGLDPAMPLHGLEPARWRQLLDDAAWLLEGFAPAAFRNGWTVADLFGVWWMNCHAGMTIRDAWGGIADRLQGARSLKMTPDRAHWRRMFSGEPDQFNRGAYPDLRPLWEPHE